MIHYASVVIILIYYDPQTIRFNLRMTQESFIVH